MKKETKRQKNTRKHDDHTISKKEKHCKPIKDENKGRGRKVLLSDSVGLSVLQATGVVFTLDPGVKSLPDLLLA